MRGLLRTLCATASLLAVEAPAPKSLGKLSGPAKLELLRALADENVATSTRPSPEGRSPAARQLSAFAREWRGREASAASQALMQFGQELTRLAVAEGHQRPSLVVAEAAEQCQQLAPYITLPGMLAGSHADHPRMVTLIFDLVWSLFKLDHTGPTGFDVKLPHQGFLPEDVGVFAEAILSLPPGRSDAQQTHLARYAVPHLLVMQGQTQEAVVAIQSATAQLEQCALQEDDSGAQQVLTLIHTSLHALLAHVHLLHGQRASAMALCEAVAATSVDFNVVYRCLLPLLPLPLPPASPRFTLAEMHTMLSNIRDQTVHGGSSVTNLHIWDLEQWLGFGARSNQLVGHLLPVSSSASGIGVGASEGAVTTDLAPLQCDAAASAQISAAALPRPRLLVVVPVVPKEGARLQENFREWQRDRHFPCSHTATDREQKPHLMLLFSRTAQEAPDWLAGGLDTLLGDAAVCFGKRWIRYANLSAAEEFYQGAWVAAGPNNLFYPLMEDPNLHTAHDFVFWQESDAFPIQPNWLDRLVWECQAPLGFWRKGPTQRPVQQADFLGMVGIHHYHMNAVGFYRLGDPCYREFLRRVRTSDQQQHC